MDINDAIALVKGVLYKPSWTITATDYTHRFESAIKVSVSIWGPDWSYPPAYSTEVEGIYHGVIIGVDRLDEAGVLRQVFDHLQRAELHESREAFRVLVGDRWVAPFHPHTVEGIEAWGLVDPAQRDRDLTHGVA